MPITNITLNDYQIMYLNDRFSADSQKWYTDPAYAGTGRSYVEVFRCFLRAMQTPGSTLTSSNHDPIKGLPVMGNTFNHIIDAARARGVSFQTKLLDSLQIYVYPAGGAYSAKVIVDGLKAPPDLADFVDDLRALYKNKPVIALASNPPVSAVKGTVGGVPVSVNVVMTPSAVQLLKGQVQQEVSSGSFKPLAQDVYGATCRRCGAFNEYVPRSSEFTCYGCRMEW